MAESLNNTLCIRATATDVNETFTMLRGAVAYDFLVIATDGGAAGVTLQNGAAAISAQLTPGGDTVSVRSATGGVWNHPARILAIGDVLTFAVSAADIAYEAYAYLYPTPAVEE